MLSALAGFHLDPQYGIRCAGPEQRTAGGLRHPQVVAETRWGGHAWGGSWVCTLGALQWPLSPQDPVHAYSITIPKQHFRNASL